MARSSARSIPMFEPSARTFARARGFSLPELLVTRVLMGLVLLAGGAVWRTTRPSVEVTSAAKLFRLMVYQARMQAIFRGVTHFVAIDPTQRRIDVYIDSGSTAGVLDALDPRVGGSALPSIVQLAMPADVSPLSNPLGGSALTSSWPLPNPTGGSWAGRKGVMVTTTGLIETVETTPTIVGNAVIVFSNGRDRASAVGIRGRMGQVRAFEYLTAGWKER